MSAGSVANSIFRVVCGLGLIGWIAYMVNVQAEYEELSAIADGPTDSVATPPTYADDWSSAEEVPLSDDWGAASYEDEGAEGTDQ